MTKQRWCVAEHHDTPCPEPCLACSYDCDGERVSTEEAMRLYPEWRPEPQGEVQ
jgi:hypothetical protein